MISSLKGLQDLWTESSSPMYPVGEMYENPKNGDRYVYVKAGGTALVAGKLYQNPAEVANHRTCAVYATAAVGATTVYITLGNTSATANQYAGGTVHFTTGGTGYGYEYKIKGHAAVDASGLMTLYLDEPLKVALTTASKADLVALPQNGVILNVAAAVTGAPVGVAMYPITASYYGWLKTKGMKSALIQGTPGIGKAVIPASTTDGAMELLSTGTRIVERPILGRMMATGINGYYKPVYLNIA